MAVQHPSRRRLVAPKGAGQAILSLQSGLATSATMRRRKRFRRLYPLLWRQEWLEQALKAVLDNAGSETPGIDGKRGSVLRDPAMKTRFITELQQELKRNGQRKYKPSPVLRAYIPKASGDLRPIGIPTLKDRVAQAALKMLLEPIFEADFLPNSNGFRPGRSTLECVLPAYRYGDRAKGYGWVIEGGIKGCFDNINHRILMKTIRQRVADRRVLRLIRSFLKAPVLERGHLVRTVKGTPQGGVLSPLLANICLNKLDQFWLENWGKQTGYQRRSKRKQGEASCVLFRYAEDFILLAKGKRDGVERIKRGLTAYFRHYLRLELSKEKTQVVSLEEGFKFLGFQIKRERLGHISSVRIRHSGFKDSGSYGFSSHLIVNSVFKTSSWIDVLKFDKHLCGYTLLIRDLLQFDKWSVPYRFEYVVRNPRIMIRRSGLFA
jgi:RNA-directed DNA polymerase